jgi:fructose/tagatose bisphosphate aldolase
LAVPLAPLTGLLADARRGGYALGYFESWEGYSLEAVLEAAEAERAPVVLGFGCLLVDGGWLDGGGIDSLGCLGRAAAGRASVPVALLLNEAGTLAQALRGLDAGFNAVMLDTDGWSAHDASDAVARLVEAARARGAAVEAAVGRLPTGSRAAGGDADGVLTDPERAAAFLAATGADCLAVSVGNVHLGPGRIDLERLEAVRRRVAAPLCLHGGSGLPAADVRAAVACGVVKVNVGTALKEAFLAGVREALPHARDVHVALGSHRDGDVLVAGKERMRAKVRELIGLYGGSGRA